MSDWVSSYHYNGYTYRRGDPLVIKGEYYFDVTDTGANGTLNNETKYFYGVFVLDDGSLPLNPIGISNSESATSASAGTIRFASIVSGGTPDTYTVSYNANGGSGAPSSQTKTHGIGLTLTSTKPSRTGYTFLGWSSTNDGTVDYYSGGLYSVNASVTLYAVWQVNTFSVKYNANGGSGNMENSIHTWDVAKELTLNAFSRIGYTFIGWGEGISDGVKYTNGQSVKNLTSDNGGIVNLFAKWEINSYNLVVNPNGGTWNGSTESKTFAQKYGTTKVISNPTRVGYTFNGWKLNGYGSFNGQTYTYGEGNGELVAQWSRIVLKVTFDASTNGGSPNSTRDVYYGDTVGSLPVPSKPFYKFIGWFTKAVGNTQISANNVITSNVTFYAQYKIDASVKVKYNGNKLPTIVWLKVNGVWKKCITWIKDNGKWNKSTGAD